MSLDKRVEDLEKRTDKLRLSCIVSTITTILLMSIITVTNLSKVSGRKDTCLQAVAANLAKQGVVVNEGTQGGEMAAIFCTILEDAGALK